MDRRQDALNVGDGKQSRPRWMDAPVVGDGQKSRPRWMDAPLANEEPKTLYSEYVAPAGEAIADAAQGVHDLFVGKHDPKYKGMSSIDETAVQNDAGLDFTSMEQAKVAGFTDEAYADIIQKQLGNRFLGRTKDANGYTVMAFRSADGTPKQAYVNKPGLDYRDIDRGLSASLPYLAAGGVVGRVGKLASAPLWTTATGQAAGQAVASAGQDVAASGMGSRQNPQTMGIDPTKAAIAAGGGFVGEYAGAILAKILRSRQVDTRLIDDSGKLSDYGRRQVTEAGFDPDLIDNEIAAEFARLSRQSEGPYEAVASVQAGQFGIPTTKGQRLNDPQNLLIEKDLRAGTLGAQAKGQMLDFDETQRQAINRSVIGDPQRTAAPPEVAQYPTHIRDQIGVAPSIAPQRTVQDLNAQTLGEGVQSGFDTARDAARQLESNAWDKVGIMRAGQEARDQLPKYINNAIGEVPLMPNQHPATMSMLNDIAALRTGSQPDNPFPELLSDRTIGDLGALRKSLSQTFRSAEKANGDKLHAKRVYDGFMRWITDMEAESLISGDGASVKAMREAMDVTKEVQGLLNPFVKGQARPAVKKIMDKIEGAMTGEEVLNQLLGRGGVSSSFKDDGVLALKSYKSFLHKYAKDMAPAAWNDVRLAYWLKVVMGPRGETLGPQAIRSNIMTALARQKSVVDTLFRKEEIYDFRRLADALKVVSRKDPNPSGSGTAMRGTVPQLIADQADILASQSKFKLTTGSGSAIQNKLMINLWRGISKRMKTPLNTGGFAANRATSQAVNPKRTPSLGGYGGAAAPNALVDRGQNER